MDGITGSPTLGGVVLATLSAAGYAVFKVTHPPLCLLYTSNHLPIDNPKPTGNVPQSDGRSTGGPSGVHIFNAGIYKCIIVLANMFGPLFDRHGGDAMGKPVVDYAIYSLYSNARYVPPLSSLYSYQQIFNIYDWTNQSVTATRYYNS